MTPPWRPRRSTKVPRRSTNVPRRFHEGPRRSTKVHEGPRRSTKVHEGPRRSTNFKISGPGNVFHFSRTLQNLQLWDLSGVFRHGAADFLPCLAQCATFALAGKKPKKKTRLARGFWHLESEKGVHYHAGNAWLNLLCHVGHVGLLCHAESSA